ncbi:hypothetical protein EOA22_30195 [Mesorhizobium sp. M7A.F.Ca.US.014.04.1.1]|nr:hypothetical protein [Mesorhizobium sp. M7A.F.Ca.US.014.04.1.1]RUX51230.1 hypothetical protein EOA22_30195 [Mesorhizobium sp. M7A.F.Ca.US.014.04.1.1]
MQSDRLVAETSLLRVRQEISKTDIEILNLGNSQASEVAAALRETQLQLNEVTSKANTAVQLLHDTEVTAPALLALRERAERAKPIFKIVRTTDSGSQELTAEETTPIEPGDTVKIDIPAPPSGLAALPVEDDVQAGTVSVQGTN